MATMVTSWSVQGIVVFWQENDEASAAFTAPYTLFVDQCDTCLTSRQPDLLPTTTMQTWQMQLVGPSTSCRWLCSPNVMPVCSHAISLPVSSQQTLSRPLHDLHTV